MKNLHIGAALVACLSSIFGMTTTSLARGTSFDFNVTVDGVDAIFLAGRTDVLPIPTPTGDPNAFVLERHTFLVPEFPLTEELPPSIPVSERAVVRVIKAAIGGVSFFSGFNGPIVGPDGDRESESNLSSLGGISGYKGPRGSLVGVFLNDSIPDKKRAPATLDFTSNGLGANFTSLSPALRQVFFIGDGFTDDGKGQRFKAPKGATRLVLGIPDGFVFQGPPGAYEDNNGGYMVLVRVTIP